MAIHTPLTTDVRAAYAAGEDFDFGFGTMKVSDRIDM